MIKYWHKFKDWQERCWYKFKHWRYKYNLNWSGIKQGIRNLVIWFPVIWFDRWWDHSFLYSILRFKLSLMEKGFRTYGISTRSEQDADNIKKCKLLLDRLTNDAYIDYEGKRGWEPKVRFSFEKEEEMIEQDLDLLFKILRKQIRAWWD